MSSEPVLTYVSDERGLENPLWRKPRFGWLPAIAVAAAVLAIEYVLIYRFYDNQVADPFMPAMVVAAFAPIFIKGRGLLRHCLALACFVLLLAAWYFEDRLVDLNMSEVRTAAMLSACVMACWVVPRRADWPGFVWRLILLCLAVGGVVLFMEDTARTMKFGSEWRWDMRRTYEPMAWALVPWVVIIVLWGSSGWLNPQGMLRRWKWLDRGMGVVMAGLLALAFNYFQSKPAIALYSLRHFWPMRGDVSIDIVFATKGGDEKVWKVLEQMDWNVSGAGSDVFERLVERDPKSIARLMALVSSHQKYQHLVDAAEWELSTRKRYEAIPILLRTALFGSPTPWCRMALMRMEAPQAAWAVLAIVIDRHAYDQPVIPLRDQEALAQVFGTDPGTEKAHWIELAEETAHGRHAPIPDAICDEADRVVDLYRSYLSAQHELDQFIGDRLEAVIGRKLDADERCILLERLRPKTLEVYPRADVERVLDQYQVEDLPRKGWDMPELERAVADYRERVRAVISGAATQPENK